MNSLVAVRHRDREAGVGVLARLVALCPVTEPREADGLGSEVKVMVHELAPLHQHVCVEVVIGDVGGRHEEGGDEARAGKVKAVVEFATVPA